MPSPELKAATIEAHGKAIDELHTQQKADHDCLTELRKDIAYIREGIQEIKQSLPKAQSGIVSPTPETGDTGWPCDQSSSLLSNLLKGPLSGSAQLSRGAAASARASDPGR